ncbi:MAG: hypothetical protein ACPGO3_03415 [Magnetospiraceae bacterium]
MTEVCDGGAQGNFRFSGRKGEGRLQCAVETVTADAAGHLADAVLGDA